MTQVSRIPLRKEIEKRIFDLFLEVVADVKTRRDVSLFLTDLLTPTERIMLAKRLSIAFLLYKDYDQRTIAGILKVSPTTVNKVSVWMQIEGNGYRKVIERIISKEKREEFWDKIDDILSEIIPPSRTNWSQARRDHWREKKKRSKAF